jgi:hypothetical protein
MHEETVGQITNRRGAFSCDIRSGKVMKNGRPELYIKSKIRMRERERL